MSNAMTPAEFVAALWEADGDAEKIMRLYERAIREAEARGMERAIKAVSDHPVQFQGSALLTKHTVGGIVEQCIWAIRAEKERT